jgi:hypothetical protein
MALKLVETLVQYKITYVYETDETFEAIEQDIENGEPVEFYQNFLGETIIGNREIYHKEADELFRLENPSVKNKQLYKRNINEI